MSSGAHVATIVRLGQPAPPPPFGPTPAPQRNPISGRDEAFVPGAGLPLHTDQWDDGTAPKREVDRLLRMLEAYVADEPRRLAVERRLEAIEASLTNRVRAAPTPELGSIGARVAHLERPWWRRGTGARRGWVRR